MAQRLARLAVVAGVLLSLLLASVAPAARAQDDPWHHRAEDGSIVVDLWFGWSSTCPHCRAAKPFIDELEARLPWLQIHRLQVNGPDAEAAVARLDGVAEVAGTRFMYVPAFLYAGRLLEGWATAETTGAQLEAELSAYHDALLSAEPAPTPAPTSADTSVDIPFVGSIDAAGISIPLLAVVLGGLDAFNPCALSVLLFLMSVLAGTRDRRRMALIGGVFVAVSGIVYFVLMAAWLNAFLVFGALGWVTVIAGLAAVVAAMINLKDHVWFRRGISLQLPEAAKPSIFGRILDIPEQARLRVMLATTILVAAVANTYEMLCTGGFPVVFTRVLTLAELPTFAYYAYIALYCLVYVVPPAIIVTLFVLTLGSRGISVREARDLKLLSGLLMLGFGVLLLFAPELLSDLGATVGLFVASIAAWLLILAVERLTGGRAAARQAG